MSYVGKGTIGHVYTSVSPNSSGKFSAIGTDSGLTLHGVLVAQNTGAFQATSSGAIGQILQSGGPAANPTYTQATYPSTTTINQLLYSSAANTIGGLATVNSATLVTTSAGVPSFTATMTNGQVVIGSTGGTPTAATLTAGTGVSITNGSGSITLAVTGGGMTWTDVTGATQALSVQNGYLTDRGGGVTYTLPAAAAAIGDVIIIVGKLGLATIAQNANQQILISSSSSTVGVGGSVAATNVGDCITLRCITSGTSSVWRAESLVGNWTIT